jgi:hypothetical protein
MQIEEYETMLVWKQLKDKKIEMTFKKTTYISICFVTLVSQSKLEKEEFDRDSFIKTLIHLKTNKQVCEIQRRFEMQLLEYNLISRNNRKIISRDDETTNSVQSSKNIMIKATSWQWHRRLEHCRSQMIDHLSKEWVSNNDDSASKTIKCEICAIFKMHRLVQKQSSARAIKFYEMLHFDLIIYEIRRFDEINCIAHFTDEFTHYSWVFSLTNHREKTLMLVFKNLINRCDRSDIAINSMIRIIRTSQETSINKRLENWIINQKIIWDWSAKNILEQNDKSKRYEALLTEKARCIREHAKLSKNLFFECYLIAEHMMNRILNQTRNWESSLIRMQKLINQSIRPEIDHLKMYECKTYLLLKDADASSRDSKLKSRAFVDYLVDYNSINIFRIWNSEKEDVNEYRDVIFDESELYDIYNKSDSLVTLEKKSQIELQNRRTMKISINQLIDLNSENDEWLETSIRNWLMLKRKRVVELSTSSSKESSQRRSSRSLTFVSSQSLADSFTDYSSLSNSSSLESKVDSKRDSSFINLTDRILEMRRKREIKRNVISVDLDEANILEEKRIRFASSKYSKSDYAQLTWIEEKWDKIFEFHVAFMTELMKFEESFITQNQINLHINTKIPNRIHICLFIDGSMKRDHVLTTSLNPWTLNHLIVDLPSPISFRKSYLFHPLNLEACSLHLIEWDRTDTVERWTDTDQSLHLDTDQKTIRDNLRRTSFDWWSTLCWVSIDHFYSWWNQRSSFEIFLIFDSDFYLYQSTLAASQPENEFDLQAIYSFEPRPTKFVPLRSQSNPRSLQATKPLQNRFAVGATSIFAYQVVKLSQWRQMMNQS